MITRQILAVNIVLKGGSEFLLVNVLVNISFSLPMFPCTGGCGSILRHLGHFQQFHAVCGGQGDWWPLQGQHQC